MAPVCRREAPGSSRGADFRGLIRSIESLQVIPRVGSWDGSRGFPPISPFGNPRRSVTLEHRG